MSYKVEIDYSPAYELIVSVYCFMQNTTLRGNELGAAWVRDVKSKLAPGFIKDLKDTRLEIIHRMGILVWQCPDKSIEGYLNWLESLSIGDIYEKMVPWIKTFKEDMRVFKERMIRVLRQWNEQYFCNIDPKILQKVEQSALLERSRIGKESVLDQIERVTAGICLLNTDVDSRVVLIPQYHCAPRTVLDFYEEGLILCQYPVAHTEENVNLQENHLLHLLKCLSDEHRLRIFEFLSRGARTYSEIQKFSGLGKGLVHYHIMQLRLAGLIHAHYRNGKLQDYGLRTGQVEAFANELLDYLHIKSGKDVSPII